MSWNKDGPMRGRRSSLKVVLSEQDRTELEQVVRSTSVRAGVARRARIVLELVAGARLVEIAERTGVTEQVVRHWGRRYLKHRLEGIILNGAETTSPPPPATPASQFHRSRPPRDPLDADKYRLCFPRPPAYPSRSYPLAPASRYR